MSVASSSSLVDALRQYRLLEPKQLDELKTLQARFPDSKALARELIDRGWLTAYQINQLLQSKAQELVLGQYILMERLGEGGMGQVFKARHRNLNRISAIKMIRKERLDNPAAIKRFQREVRAAAALDHPNIVRALDADEIGGTHLLVMEYIEGATDLARLVKKNGPLPVAQACEYIRQAALGLQHANERGLVHRDIKPANLLVTADGSTVKVLDMGLARLDHAVGDDDKSSTMTQEGTVMGTPDYIAPEQALESHTVDIRADLYSLGCTLYYLLTAKVPFPGGTFIQKINKHQFEEPFPVEKLRPEVAPEVARVVRKLMAKKRDDRYQTPAELAAALAVNDQAAASENDKTFAENTEAIAARRLDRVRSPFADLAASDTEAWAAAPQHKPQKRRRLVLGVAGGSLLLVGGVVLLLLLKQPGDNKPSTMDKDRPGVAVGPAKNAPAKVDDAWLKEVAAMPAEKQVEAVAAKLKELNPGFDGKVTHKVEGDVVTDLRFLTDNVTDVSPVRALNKLKVLYCGGSDWGKGKLSDLNPLKDMKLTFLYFAHTQVSDLSPLKDMKLIQLDCGATKVSDLSPLKGLPLTSLVCYGTKVSDLSPLKGMSLTDLHCVSTNVSDLSPLKGMPLSFLYLANTNVSDLSPLKDMKLTSLTCIGTKVIDLSPLKDMKLTHLYCGGTKVIDLSPLKDMKLTHLYCGGTKVTDLSLLKDMPLKELDCDFKPERDAEILRSIKTLERINFKEAKEFWKEVEAMKMP